MKKSFIIVISFIIFLWVVGWTISLFVYDRGSKQANSNYPKKNYQAEASIILKQRGIRHKIDPEGVLRYNRKDEKVVRDTYEEIQKEHIPDWPNIYWANSAHKERLIQFLVSNNISYLIRKLDASGNDYIMWEPSFDDKVKKVNGSIVAELKEKYE